MKKDLEQTIATLHGQIRKYRQKSNQTEEDRQKIKWLKQLIERAEKLSGNSTPTTVRKTPRKRRAKQETPPKVNNTPEKDELEDDFQKSDGAIKETVMRPVTFGLKENGRWTPVTNQEMDPLVKACLAGDPEAEAKLASRLRPFFQRIIGSSYHSGDVTQDDIEDIVQNALLRLLHNLHKYTPDTNFIAWSAALAGNVARDFIKKKARDEKHRFWPINKWGDEMDIEEDMTDLADQRVYVNGPEIFEHHELQTKIRIALSQLSPTHREVVTLYYLEGLIYEDIAQILNCPLGTVKSRLHYAKYHLRDLLLGEFSSNNAFT